MSKELATNGEDFVVEQVERKYLGKRKTVIRVDGKDGSLSLGDGAIFIDEEGNVTFANGIPAGDLGDGSVTTPKLANLAVTAAKIANATITATQIAATTITGAQIANTTITNTQLAAGAAAANLGAAGGDLTGTYPNPTLATGVTLPSAVSTGYLQLASFNNTTRPVATLVPTGGVIFNTDDKEINISDGTNWYNAVGELT